MSTLTTLVEYLRQLLGDEGARQDFRLDPKGHLKGQGFDDVSEPELREAVSLVGHDHGADPGFGDLSAAAASFGTPDAAPRGPVGGLGGVGDDATAANQAANTNASDGEAAIVTGNAQAVGNVAETTIVQTGPTFGSGGGIYIGDQEANVTNIGTATANTGNNVAVGNASDNDATSFQDASAGGGFGGGVGDDATAANQAANTNASDGEAAVVTGNASAVGNVAETNIVQTGPTFGEGGGIYIGDQEANVTNVGVANANTGGNVAVGNASDNDATSFQDASAGGGFGGGVGDDATAANAAQNASASDGSAGIATGNASAVGNVAETDIFQGTGVTFGDGPGGGIWIHDQDANVTNIADASANTGGNVAVGNDSDNDATSFQDADAGDVI